MINIIKNRIIKYIISFFHREVEKAEKPTQQAVPQTNHVHVNHNSSQSESRHRTEREEPHNNGVRVAHGDEVKYGGAETQGGRPSQSAADDRAERLSPNPAHKNEPPQTVIQVTLPPPEQNGNLVYQRGFVSQGGGEKNVQRKNTLAQVEQWVKVQKGDPLKRSV